uniref:Zinc finger protein 81 n=1 Tax=Mus musculus TaxID=10090 RepID=A0A3Q4EGF8_MOUSE
MALSSFSTSHMCVHWYGTIHWSIGNYQWPHPKRRMLLHPPAATHCQQLLSEGTSDL